MSDLSTAIEAGAFKHVVVPIGLVVGLGLARTMTSASSYIQQRARVRFSLGHTLWSVVMFLWFVGLWWIAWGLRHVDAERWSFFALIFLLIGPCLMFLAGSLLMPDLPAEGELDLGARLETLARPFFACLIGFVLWLVGTELWLQREPWVVLPKRLAQATALALFTIGVGFPSRRTATVLGAIMLPLVVIAMATVRAKLG